MLKDMPEIKLVRRQLGPFVAEEETELWSWEAGVLERHGFAIPLRKTTPAELRKLILMEERSSALAPLPEDFYRSAAREISTLRETGEIEKADGLRSQTLALVEIRLPKLLRLALSPNSISGLSLEEHFLVNRLANLLENWGRRLSQSLEKAGEEVEKNGSGRIVQHSAGDETDIQKPGVPASELHT
jgi:DNA replication initiation complex subunit (GINS family)